MKMEVSSQGRLKVIKVSGSLSSAYSPQLRETIKEAFKSKIRGVVVDLSGVGYMDSSGLATLVEGVQLAEERKSKFVLAGLIQERVQHLLEITRLNNLFERFETVETAKTKMVSLSK